MPRKEAQVRSYGIMVLLHESRYGDAPDLSEEEYERFLDKLMDTLFEGGIRLVLLVPDLQDHEPTQLNPMPSPAAQRSAQPAVAGTLSALHSSRAVIGAMLLVALAFGLGMVAGPLFSWIAHAVSWVVQVPSWLQQAG